VLDARPPVLRRGRADRPEGGRGLAFIRTLYAVENELKGERARLGQGFTDDDAETRAGPILATFADWLEVQNRTTTPKSLFGQAANYARNDCAALEVVASAVRSFAGDRPSVAADLIERLAQGVTAAHAAGLIHRDLKPENVQFAAGGSPKISDLGLAKRLADASDGLTVTGAVLGTPSYMAPEQASGDGK